MDEGFLEEVRGLVDRPRPLGRTARQALGYRELLTHVEDGADLADALETAKVRTRRFARRQLKWFGRDPRIDWVDLERTTGTQTWNVDHTAAVERGLELLVASGWATAD